MKVVYTDNVFGNSLIEEERYKEAGYEYVEASAYDEETLKKECRDADAVVCCYAQITEGVIQAMENCKVVVKAGMGVNNINIPAASAKGIMVANVQKYCLDEVADHAVALTMSLVRKTDFMDRRVRAGKWEGVAPARPIFRIKEMQFCLYGFGGIARYMAQKFKAIGFRMAAYDPFLPDEVFQQAGVERITEESELFRRADVLAVQLNLNEKTAGIISYEKLKLMKPTAIFINTARGGLVDEPGLIRALQEGTIGGAGLDVLADEHPDMSSPLFQMENVCITPHIAYYSTGSDVDLRHAACEQVIGALERGAPEFLLNGAALGW